MCKATNQIADRDNRIASLTLIQSTDTTVLTPQSNILSIQPEKCNNDSELLKLKEQNEILQKESEEKKQEILILTESLLIKKQNKKDEKIINMKLKSEILELLILVQNSREELKENKIELHRVGELLVEYRQKDSKNSIRYAQMQGELINQNALDNVKERALKVS